MRQQASSWTRTMPALLVGAVVAGATGAGALVAAFAVVSLWVRGEQIPWLMNLLLPGVLVIGVGQLWAMAMLLTHLIERHGIWVLTSRVWPARPFALLGRLHPIARGVLYAAFFAAWLSAAATFVLGPLGEPTSGTEECPYRLVNRGNYTCVDKATYQRAGPAGQRFAVSIVFGFMVAHCGVALAGLRWDPDHGSTPRPDLGSTPSGYPGGQPHPGGHWSHPSTGPLDQQGQVAVPPGGQPWTARGQPPR